MEQTNHLGNISATSLSIHTKKNKEEVQYAISDSGATGTFLVQGAPLVNKKLTSSPLKIKLLNGKMIHYTHTCNLDIPWLPNTVTEAHIVPDLSHSSMSNVTLQPKSVNFLVDMRDEWERSGTICASVTVFGSTYCTWSLLFISHIHGKIYRLRVQGYI